MRAKNLVLSMFAAVALTFANLGGSINCMGVFYQPKYPGKNESDCFKN